MEQGEFIPQSQIYTIFNEKNPLYNLAVKYPTNMCWLTALLYALQLMGFENNRKLHIKLTSLLSSSLSLLFISKENGAMYFPKKYELNDGYIKNNLNEIFKKSGLNIRIIKVISDIKFEEIAFMEKYLSENKQLIAIVKNKELYKPDENNSEVPNHTILITELMNYNNGVLKIGYIDPADGRKHQIEIGINVFMQWIQYVWVCERKYGILEKIFKKK